MIDVYKLPVHPKADLFPMLDEESLKELAESIKETGLQEPLVIAHVEDVKGKKSPFLIDGRNRLAACKIAGIKSPPFEELADATDIEAFILNANIHRRHMTKGQRAMAVAMMYPEATDKGGRGKRGTFNVPLSKTYLKQARLVQRVTPEACAPVIDGILSLNEAHDTAVEVEKASKDPVERLKKIAKVDSTLASRVKDEELTLREAEAVLKEREQEKRDHQKAVVANIDTGLRVLGMHAGTTAKEKEETVEDIVKDYREYSGNDINAEELDAVIEFLAAIRKELDK